MDESGYGIVLQAVLKHVRMQKALIFGCKMLFMIYVFRLPRPFNGMQSVAIFGGCTSGPPPTQ